MDLSLPWVYSGWEFDYFGADGPYSMLGYLVQDLSVAATYIPYIGFIFPIIQITIPFWMLVFATFGLFGYQFDDDGMVSMQDEEQTSLLSYYYQFIFDNVGPVGLFGFYNVFTWEGWFWAEVNFIFSIYSFSYPPLLEIRWFVILIIFLIGNIDFYESYAARFNWYDPNKLEILAEDKLAAQNTTVSTQ